MSEDALPGDLKDAYHERCNVEGADFEDFLDEARGRWPAPALVALVDAVEADILTNMAMMVEERPEMEAAAQARAVALREHFAKLRSRAEEPAS
jgi:hypothetical protein